MSSLQQRTETHRKSVERVLRGARPGKLAERFRYLARPYREILFKIQEKPDENPFEFRVKVSRLGYVGYLDSLVREEARREEARQQRGAA